MEPDCIARSHTNNLPTPADLNENHYGGNGRGTVCTAANQKSATVTLTGIAIELNLVSTWPII
jgi:hypothetical protein